MNEEQSESVREKYQSLLDMAERVGVSDLRIIEEDGVLYITGFVESYDTKQQLWDEYRRLDPEFRSGDLVLDIVDGYDSGVGTSSGDVIIKRREDEESAVESEERGAGDPGIDVP